MNWRREYPGTYTAGPYKVERLVTRWTAQGPGVAEAHENKVDAQAACQDAALTRIVGNELTCTPVIGDVVTVPDGYRRGRYPVKAVLTGANGVPLYCMALPRGRRLCLLRHEFQVMLP